MSDTTAQDAEFDALWAKVEAKVRKEHADDPLLENHLDAAYTLLAGEPRPKGD
jgi:hypothetical protein